MTFNKMRFPIVWITLALFVALCTVEVRCGPAGSRQDVDLENFERSPRQYPYLDDEEGSEEGDDDEEQQLNFPASANGSEDGDDDDYAERSFRRRRDAVAAQIPEETEEESVIPPVVPEKKPSVLELLSSALDKAIEATSKIPTQQVASDAAGVFQILGQVFSEAIDKVIGNDDGPDDNTAEVVPESIFPPVNEQQPIKVEEQQQEQQQESSQSDKEIVNNL